MAFYKRDGQSLLDASVFVRGPNFTLNASQKDSYAYPVYGWYWFDTLDAAMASPYLKADSSVTSVSKRQAQLALLDYGMLDAVDRAVASMGREAQINWEAASTIDRNNPFIESIAKGLLRLSDAQLDQLFALAATK